MFKKVIAFVVCTIRLWWITTSIIVIQVHDKLHEKLFISKFSFLWINESDWDLLKNTYGEKLIIE